MATPKKAKLRAAIVLADAGREGSILCQVNRNPYGDPRALRMVAESFSSGSLRSDSYARPGRLFTAGRDLMLGQVATVSADRLRRPLSAGDGADASRRAIGDG